MECLVQISHAKISSRAGRTMLLCSIFFISRNNEDFIHNGREIPSKYISNCMNFPKIAEVAREEVSEKRHSLLTSDEESEVDLREKISRVGPEVQKPSLTEEIIELKEKPK